MTPEDLISTKEAAAILERSPRTLESWRHAKADERRLPYYTDGYRIWYSLAEVEAYREKSLAKIEAVL